MVRWSKWCYQLGRAEEAMVATARAAEMRVAEMVGVETVAAETVGAVAAAHGRTRSRQQC